MHALKKKLLLAQKEKETRAVLVYNGSKQIQVYADKGLLFEGAQGQDYIDLTTEALGEFYNIVCPIWATFFVVLFFLRQVENFASNLSVHKLTAINLPDLPRANSSNEMEILYAVITFAGIFVALFCLRRFRDQFLALFRVLMMIDIFFILAVGTGTLLMVFSVNLNISTDVFSSGFFAVNFGMIGLLSFYWPVGQVVHRIFLVILFELMAIIIGTVMDWIALFFVSLFAITDSYAMLRPRFAAEFTPFILPRNFQIPNTTPRVFYEINGLRLRATDFLFYGLMAVFPRDNRVAITVAFISVFAGCLLCLYVLPFFSKKIRPFPVAFALLLLSLFITNHIVNPYLADNAVKWTLMHP
jgi:hypothetical protein